MYTAYIYMQWYTIQTTLSVICLPYCVADFGIMALYKFCIIIIII